MSHPESYGVRSVPTMMLFKGRQAVDVKIGAGTPRPPSLTGWNATPLDAR
ncbi:hypothetical protein [Devosia psychrophila]|nr:hypothetical protein [Devosia psychrophila]